MNNEFNKEINYWKSCAVTNFKDAEHLKSQAPKHRMLIPKKKKPSRHEDVDNLLDLLKSKYDLQLPKIDGYIPNISHKIKNIKEIKPYLKEYASYMKNIENFSLKNACLLGGWLCIAFKIYRKEIYLFKNVDLPRTFEKWININFNISKTRSCTYRNLAKLVKMVPKLIHCRVSVSFLMEKCIILKTYFENKY